MVVDVAEPPGNSSLIHASTGDTSVICPLNGRERLVTTISILRLRQFELRPPQLDQRCVVPPEPLQRGLSG